MARATRSASSPTGPRCTRRAPRAPRAARPRQCGSPRRSCARSSRSPRLRGGSGSCVRVPRRPARWLGRGGARRALWPVSDPCGPGSGSKLTRESTLPAGTAPDANLCRCSMRFRAPSHARVSASVPAVRDEPVGAGETAPPPPVEDTAEGAPRRNRSRVVIVAVVLGLIVVVGLVLRLRNNGYGLPYVYNFDEWSHFVRRSVHVFG